MCDDFFLVPTLQRGNAVSTALAVLDDALDSVATSKRWTLARGNEKGLGHGTIRRAITQFSWPGNFTLRHSNDENYYHIKKP
jgi:hypothetical protein